MITATTMEESLISIIVPVYNVESYLKKCVDSIINQTYQKIEVILVDDGSSDGCAQICDEYQDIDNRVRVLHKKNGGLSSARNAGIGIATGEYLGFVDSDDYIANDMFEVLINNIKQNDADMAVCGVFECFEGTSPKIDERHLYYEVNKETALNLIFDGRDASVSACRKLYKKALFDDIRFPEGKISEDAFVIVDILRKCNKVVITTDQYYYYIRRTGSITTEKPSDKMFDAIEAYERNLDLIKKYFPSQKKIGQKRLYWSYFYVLDRILTGNAEKEYRSELNDIVSEIRKNSFQILRTKISIKRKVLLIPLMISPVFYKKCIAVFYSTRRRATSKLSEN